MSQTFLKRVKEENVLSPGDSVLLGLSGGVDSVVLLDVLCKLAPVLGLKLTCAHVNYGLRGRESERDEKFVKALAKKYRVKLFVKNVAERFSVPSTNLQNLARNLRYDFFIKTARKIGADKIAVAHHADDQAETILLHLIRGSGLGGLTGMSPTSFPHRYVIPAQAGISGMQGSGGIALIRPLLSLTKGEILAYAKDRGLKYVQDRTNRTSKYTRNAVRRDVLPLLSRYNPSIVAHICKTAAILRDEDDALNKIATEAFEKLSALSPHGLSSRRKPGSSISFSRARFLKNHIAVQRRILRLAYARLTGGTADLLTDHIDKMIWIIASGTKKGSYCLPKGIKFERKGEKIILA
jgi:tRNA(Ile)-lysidine synthase